MQIQLNVTKKTWPETSWAEFETVFQVFYQYHKIYTLN